MLAGFVRFRLRDFETPTLEQVAKGDCERFILRPVGPRVSPRNKSKVGCSERKLHTVCLRSSPRTWLQHQRSQPNCIAMLRNGMTLQSPHIFPSIRLPLSEPSHNSMERITSSLLRRSTLTGRSSFRNRATLRAARVGTFFIGRGPSQRLPLTTSSMSVVERLSSSTL